MFGANREYLEKTIRYEVQNVGGKWKIKDNLDGGYLEIDRMVAWRTKEYAQEALDDYVKNYPKAQSYVNAVLTKTRDVAQYAKTQGYDGVIFKNIRDNGVYSNGRAGASTVAIAFNSNQIKSVANKTPTTNPDIRFVIAPHEMEEARINKILQSVRGGAKRYTECDAQTDFSSTQVLVLDTIGILSSVYGYATWSYIGGGFGVGIHNVLEAAVYGIPVIFGPNNKKFREAQHLLANKGGFEINGYEDFEVLMDKFLSDEAYLNLSGQAAGDYVKNNSGAMEKIMNCVKL